MNENIEENDSNEQPYYKYDIPKEQFRRAVALTEEYFGVGLGYFCGELAHATGGKAFDAEYPDLAALEIACRITIFTTWIWDDYLCMFTEIDFNDDLPMESAYDIINALFILGSKLADGKYDAIIYKTDPASDEMFYGDVRKDLLKLYIFSKSEHETGTVTIKQGKGAEHKVDLENASLWFYPRMVNEYLQKYLPDITSTEQAQAELDTRYRARKGRGYNDIRLNIIIYGIYRLFSKTVKSPVSDPVCDMMISYLELFGLISHGDPYVTREWLRAQVAYMDREKRDNPPKFRKIGLSQQVSIEVLKNSDVRQF